jgi:hypothetical protein
MNGEKRDKSFAVFWNAYISGSEMSLEDLQRLIDDNPGVRDQVTKLLMEVDAELKRRLSPEAYEAHQACVVKTRQEDERSLAELRRKKLILRKT